MTTVHTGSSSRQLRTWPAAAAVALVVILKLAAALVPGAALAGMLGALAAGVIIVLWWLFFSRAPWLERLGVLALMIAAVAAVRYVVDPSIRGGMMGMMLAVYFAVPGLPLALAGSAIFTRGSAPRPPRAPVCAAILLTGAAVTTLRTHGIKDSTAQP